MQAISGERTKCSMLTSSVLLMVLRNQTLKGVGKCSPAEQTPRQVFPDGLSLSRWPGVQSTDS